MKTVLYANGLKKTGKELQTIIHAQIPGMQVNIHNSIEQVSQTLRQPLNHVAVVILLIGSKDELVQFNFLKSLFDNIRIILILPDRRKKTLALGFKLKPSFVSDVDSDLQDVASVLGQIIKKSKEKMQNG